MDESNIVEIAIAGILIYVVLAVVFEVLPVLSDVPSDFFIRLVFWVIVGGIIAMFIDAATSG